MRDEANAHGGHGEHQGGVGVEPDVRRVGVVVGWGIAMFIGVIVVIGLLTGYFWWERHREDQSKVNQAAMFGDQMREIHAREESHLHKTEQIEGGRYRIPIDRAMDLVVRDGL
jgi:hypothetical protein